MYTYTYIHTYIYIYMRVVVLRVKLMVRPERITSNNQVLVVCRNPILFSGWNGGVASRSERPQVTQSKRFRFCWCKHLGEAFAFVKISSLETIWELLTAAHEGTAVNIFMSVRLEKHTAEHINNTQELTRDQTKILRGVEKMTLP